MTIHACELYVGQPFRSPATGRVGYRMRALRRRRRRPAPPAVRVKFVSAGVRMLHPLALVEVRSPRGAVAAREPHKARGRRFESAFELLDRLIALGSGAAA